MNVSIHKPNFLFLFFGGIFLIALATVALTEVYAILAIPFLVVFLYYSWQNRTNIFYLLLFALPFSFEYQVTPELGTDIPDELLMVLSSFLFLAGLIWQPRILSRKTWQHPLLLLLLIGFGWTAITMIFSTQPLVSLKYLLAKSWYIGAFVMMALMVFREKQQFTKAIRTLSISVLLVTIIELARHSVHGFSFASINDALYPFFRNHVNYSAMLVCVIPVLFVFLRFSDTKIKKRLAIAAILVALFALFFSYSRGAWLALAGGMLAGWLIRKRAMVYFYVLMWMLVLGSVFWLKNNNRYLEFTNDFNTTIFHTNFQEHLIATYKLKDVSTAERFYRWVAGIRMIKDKALTGYGPSTFYHNYKPYTVPAFKTWVSSNKDHSTVHNYFLLLAIEQGIPGLLFFLLLLGAMFWYAQHLYHRIEDVFYKTIAITIGMILFTIVVVNFLSDLVETDKIGSLFYLCLAGLIITDIKTTTVR